MHWQTQIVAKAKTTIRLNAEIDTCGNVEYKYILLHTMKNERFYQLVTQLNWRINEGCGVAVYFIGVRDDGRVCGIPMDQLVASMEMLEKMTIAINHARLVLEEVYVGSEMNCFAVRCKIHLEDQPVAVSHLRVSVLGQSGSGKSTIIGVLTKGVLDNGHGSARMHVFRHLHEIENGSTSSVSSIELVPEESDKMITNGFCNNGVFKRKWTKVVDLCDMAGQKRYLKTTASGMTGLFPDYSMLVVDAIQGVEQMTKEHLFMAMNLKLDVFVVVTKMDLASQDQINRLIQDLTTFLKTQMHKDPVFIEQFDENKVMTQDTIPVFIVSSVSGTRCDDLRQYILNLKPRQCWKNNSEYPAFCINNSHKAPGIGIVVVGIVTSGTLSVGMTMLVGPMKGNFFSVVIKSIHAQREIIPKTHAGQTAAMLIQGIQLNLDIRKGTMLVHPNQKPKATYIFDAELKCFAKDILKENYQAVVHADGLYHLRLQFLYTSEYIQNNLPMIFREGMTTAAGRVIQAIHS